MAKLTMRVLSTDLLLESDTPVLFDAGIDTLDRFDTGQRFHVEVEVVNRGRDAFGEQLTVTPVGVAP